MIKTDYILRENYGKITNRDCPSFSGIVAGECKGDLWVDRTDDPGVAIVYSYAVGSFAFLGKINNKEQYRSLKDFIENDIFRNLKHKGTNYFEYSIEHDGLKPYIQEMFRDRIVQSEKEYSLRKKEAMKYKETLPDGFCISRVDSELWDRAMYGVFNNGAFLTKRVLENWGSFESFEKKGIGFCITCCSKIAAVLVGTARFDDVISIDIETEDEFRHQGLGYILTGEFVNECMQKGCTAQWDCVESNPISRALAEKAGFTLFKENTVYWFEI